MKTNPRRTWMLVLWSRQMRKFHTCIVTGTYDQALSHADVLECQLSWQVYGITIEVTSNR